MDVGRIAKELPWIFIIGLVALTYCVFFIGRNYEAIAWNMGNHCTTMPMNFGACY